jgi:hypothetical protein
MIDVRSTARDDARADVVLGAAAVVGGVAFLWLRPAFANVPNAAAVLGAGYVLLLWACVAVPVPEAIAVPAGAGVSATVLAVGVAAVLAARALTTPAIGWPTTAWSPMFNATAAVAEEALFRRVGFGWLERHGRGLAVAATAVAFGLVHVAVYGAAVLPVDVGAGLVLSWQRAATGRWSVPAATHVAANLVAMVP